MILATQSGNMTAVKVVRETAKGFIYNDLSMNGAARTKERRISKDDPTRNYAPALMKRLTGWGWRNEQAYAWALDDRS